MKDKSKQSGLTLTEMTVVIVTVALLTSFGLPAVRTLFNSMATSGGTRAMISAALASARAIAAKEQHYAGIRFQKAYSPDGPQYMIFIVQDPEILAWGFRAVEGIQPIRLPDNIGVMDSSLIREAVNSIPNWEPSVGPELTDLTAFSIVFSPSGKLVIHQVQVRNRDGKTSAAPIQSKDDIFNTESQVTSLTNPFGMFIQDDYPAARRLKKEPSRSSFIIYDRREFKQALEKSQAYSGYLVKLVPEAIYINPYTGTMIGK